MMASLSVVLESRVDSVQRRTFGTVNSGRLNNFDFLRFLLAALVILSHSYPLLWGNNERELLSMLTGGQLSFGELAVNGFFILSGFLIAQSWENSRTVSSYFKKRVLRIYPGYLATVLFCTLITGPFLAAPRAEYWEQLNPVTVTLKALNLDAHESWPKLYDHLPYPAVNGSLWTIRYEFFCYIGVALLGFLGAFRYKIIAVLAFAVAVALYVGRIYYDLKMPGSSLSHIYCYPGEWPRFATYYLAGMLFYLFQDRIVYSGWLALVCLMGLIACAAFHTLQFLPLAFAFFGTYVFFYVAFLPTPCLQRFVRRGDFSYGLYLYAFPIQQMLVYSYRDLLTPLTLFLLAFPLTLLAAFLSWHLVEKPFMVRKPKATIIPTAP
jgi:peptidoglycan/LPS O-acetylase OafA/YrhL